ncbi:hypothetical protein JCM8202_001294 [Rhodotorula sphaerocarpa]
MMGSAQRPLLIPNLDGLTPLPLRKRPSYLLRIAVLLSVLVVVVITLTRDEPKQAASLSLQRLKSLPSRPWASAATTNLAVQSCEVCHLDPTNPLCEYGEHNIRLSRAFEGSGYRLQRFMRKVLAGEEVQIGVLGASVTQGHSVPFGNPIWHEVWFKDFQERYPNSKMHVGAVGATDSEFFSYCFPALLPVEDIDLFLVELDVNNDPGLKTLKDDDALMRGLLQQPKEPAIIRISFFATIFHEQGRGTLSTLITSQFFDIPVISVRNFMLPEVIKHRDSAEIIFGLDYRGQRDYRHVSELSHRVMANMLTLFVRKETCELKRQDLLPAKTTHEMSGPWWKEEDLGTVPDITLYESWLKPKPRRVVTPLCHSTVIPRSPLIPVSRDDAFVLTEWNGKSAWISNEPGSQIRLRFVGSKVGLFLYSMAAPGKSAVAAHMAKVTKGKEPPKEEEEGPGMAVCWVEEPGEHERELADIKAGRKVKPKNRIEWVVDSHDPRKPAAGTEFTELADDLEPGVEHILACEVSKETTSGGHKWRLQAIASL